MTAVRAVFDCNFLLQAAFRRSSFAAECLQMVDAGQVELYASAETLDEIQEVISRPDIQDTFRTLLEVVAEAFLLRLRRVSRVVSDVPPVFTYPRDPTDEPYLNLALAVKANYIVSQDKDLLQLMTDHTIEAKEFRQRLRNVKIVTPMQFVKSVRDLSS